MKKIIIFAVFSLIISSISVFADSFTIHKGWNLVSNQILDELPNGASGKSFLFDSLNKNYVFYSDSNSEEVSSLISSMSSLYGSEELYVYSTPLWYYSDKEIPLDLELEELFAFPSYLGDISNFGKLFSGWNLITVNTLMINKRFMDFKGDCNYISGYLYRTDRNEWERGDADEYFQSELLGKGIAIKVSDNCNLEFEGSTISSPPSLPTDSNGCTDSDGGKNYYVKGTMTGYEESGDLLTVIDYCLTDDRVVEYFCADNYYGDDQGYECPNGCQDGACIR